MPQPVIGAEADLDVSDNSLVAVVGKGGVVYVEAGVWVFTAVVMPPLHLSQVRPTAVFGDQFGGVGA